MWGCSEKTAICQPERGPWPQPYHTGTLISDFQTLELWETNSVNEVTQPIVFIYSSSNRLRHLFLFPFINTTTKFYVIYMVDAALLLDSAVPDPPPVCAAGDGVLLNSKSRLWRKVIHEIEGTGGPALPLRGPWAALPSTPHRWGQWPPENWLLWSQETPSHSTFLSGQEHRYLDFSLTPAASLRRTHCSALPKPRGGE